MFNEIKYDLPASIVVFFVAVPLCLGLALASGAPLFAGIIAGIIGGIVVGIASGSAVGVSGPGNGLTIIVLTTVASLGGSWQGFLTALVLAGIIQFILGFAKVGFVTYFFPSSVIKGMLAGIGLLIMLKQVPHALGYDRDNEGDWSFLQIDGENSFDALASALNAITPGAALIGIVALMILILWETSWMRQFRIFQIIQGSIVAVIIGIVLNFCYRHNLLPFSLSPEQIVSIPVIDGLSGFIAEFTHPDFSYIVKPQVWQAAGMIALVASLETLLSVEAADRLDPYKRITSPDRELMAQGLGNILSGFCGGLPITQVIVRSSVNISFGARTKLSAILHGVLLLLSALFLAGLLNQIPLASLAAILIMVGYKLTKPVLYREMYRLGNEQFVPFIATVIGMLTTDLLQGVLIGMGFGVFFTLRQSYYNSHTLKDLIETEHGQEVHHIVLAEDLSFFSKPSLLKTLNKIPKHSKVIIDGSRSRSIAFDVRQFIQEYCTYAKTKDIDVETINLST